METLIRSQILVSMTCCNCGVLFAFPEELNEKFQRDHGLDFCCPNGHKQHYLGKTEEQKLQAELEREQQAREWAENRARKNFADAERQRRRVNAYKGVVTKMRNRIANGVCPVPGCKRTGFANVKNHIHNQHPDWAHENLDVLSVG